MFKKIHELGNQVQMTKSDIKDVKKGLSKSFPALEEFMEDIIPKKAVLYSMKLKMNEKAELTLLDNTVICFKIGKQIFPSLWLLHQYPHILPHFQVDKGAIRFVLAGANIMCPGLTSPGGQMAEVESGSIVAIHGEGKQHALGIGIAIMSTEEIRTKNKDIGVNTVQYAGDDLWKLDLTK